MIHELSHGDSRRTNLTARFAVALFAAIGLLLLTGCAGAKAINVVSVPIQSSLSKARPCPRFPIWPGFMLITGKALGLSPLIGLLMLMGIAAKNSILLVEYALIAERKRGMSRFEALIDAARKRARPIVMTSIAMGAGMLPIALGIGADAETRAPMAIAVIGGLLSSTVLSLVYVPVVYTIMDDIQRFLGRHLSRLLVERSDADNQAATAISGKDPGHAHPV